MSSPTLHDTQARMSPTAHGGMTEVHPAGHHARGRERRRAEQAANPLPPPPSEEKRFEEAYTKAAEALASCKDLVTILRHFAERHNSLEMSLNAAESKAQAAQAKADLWDRLVKLYPQLGQMLSTELKAAEYDMDHPVALVQIKFENAYSHAPYDDHDTYHPGGFNLTLTGAHPGFRVLGLMPGAKT